MSLFDDDPATPALTLQKLISIEDTPELLAPQCRRTEIPVWPNIRVAFLRKVMADRLFASGSIDPPTERRPLRAVRAFARSVAHNEAAMLRATLKSDLLLSTESIGDEERGGRWFNRYVDPFGDLPSGQAVVLTDMFDWTLNRPRHNERVYYHAPIQVAAAVAGRLPVDTETMRLAEATVDIACARAASLLNWDMGDERRAAFVTWAARKLAGLPLRYRAYRRLIRSVAPKLLIGSSGCYGIHAPLIAAARDLGVVTAEYQHGAISAGHDAYSFAPAIFASEAYRRTLPQYLLTYGCWWSGQVHAPIECVEVGNPAREERVQQLQRAKTPARTVLILGDGIEFDFYLDFARAIARGLSEQGLSDKSLTVVLRPHPMERAAVVARHGLAVDGVEIDVTPDIYGSFAAAHTVISELSTGLFEAVGLGPRVAMLNTSKARFAFPEHPFVTVGSVEEAVAFIRRPADGGPDIAAQTLWATDWQANYRRFLTEKTTIIV
jgi:hypothetical protein